MNNPSAASATTNQTQRVANRKKNKKYQQQQQQRKTSPMNKNGAETFRFLFLSFERSFFLESLDFALLTSKSLWSQLQFEGKSRYDFDVARYNNSTGIHLHRVDDFFLVMISKVFSVNIQFVEVAFYDHSV